MIEFVLVPLTLVALSVAAYCDLRTREVPDWLSYGFLFAVIGIRVLFSFEEGWLMLVDGLLGFGVFYILALVFYYSRQWGGGDAKLLMGMGALIGLSYPWGTETFHLPLFFVLLLVLGSVYGVAWLFGLAIVHRKIVWPAYREMLAGYKKLVWGMLLLSIVLAGFSLVVPLLWLIASLPFLLTVFLLFVSVMEKNCFHKKIDPIQATEGDWLYEAVCVGGKRVMEPKELLGADLHRLVEWKKEKKISHIVVKEGVPFVPSFLIAYIAFLFLKDSAFSALFTLLH